MTDVKYPTQFDLTGKSAIVTGAAGILGTEFCKGLLQSGAKVVASDINADGLGHLSETLAPTHKDNLICVKTNVSDPKSVAELIGRAEADLGDISILVNNAASKTKDLEAFFAPFEEYSLETWREITSVNLDGVFLVAQAVGKHMVSRGIKGSIIQTSSLYGFAAPDHRIYQGAEYLGVAINSPAVYSASKAGVLGLTKWLATYWGSAGIRVNSLIPGGVQSGQNDTFVENYSRRAPMGRMAEKEELVGTVIYLASEASSYVTGQALIVDGGLTAW